MYPIGRAVFVTMNTLFLVISILGRCTVCPERAKSIFGDFSYHIEYVISRLTLISSFQKCNCFFRIFYTFYSMIV